MKYMLLCLAALTFCLLLGGLITHLIKKRYKKLCFKGSSLLGTLLFGVILLGLVSLIYLSVHYSAGNDAAQALNGDSEVEVSEIKFGYYFNGPGEDTALIFYPGAKVAAQAYAPLMLELARRGIDCFLTEMPFNMAIFGSGRAEYFINSYNYESWLIGGHSMGGLIAASFAESHAADIKGLVLLAAYPANALPASLRLLSIYGTNDTVLSKADYENDKVNWPENVEEFVINGGNHSGFADYGAQKGDGKAEITRKEQTLYTVAAIIEWNK